jgi:hypothetical protein
MIAILLGLIVVTITKASTSIEGPLIQTNAYKHNKA